MRLIDADDLLVQYDKEHEGPPGRARELIENAPTVKDAVKVIRCKDCIHRPTINDKGVTNGFGLQFPDNSKCPCRCDDPYYSWMPNDNWFCGNGEKEEKNK